MSIPRRAQLYSFTPAEKAIWEAKQEVEKVGAHPLLTDAVMLLNQAQDKVADYVDTILPKKRPIRLQFRKEDGSRFGKIECVEMSEEQLERIYPDLYRQLFSDAVTESDSSNVPPNQPN